ncbi:MAG: hypothetical protein LBG29_05565 [Synergistaceae bacterium]|jgi:hypothetical protein|nr:hypothetical protein [Synergistaceae bacterium]
MTDGSRDGREKQARGLRRNLYEHIGISLRTADIIIAAVSISIIVFIVLGILR